MTPKARRLALLALLLLFLACQLTEVGRVTNLRGDEAYYIHGADSMIRSGDWLTPRYESGQLRFEKPILTYWIVALPMKLLGLGHGFAPVRIPSVLLALATLPFVYGLARVLLRDPVAAFFAVAAHITLKAVYSNAHQARTDTLLAFFVIAAVYFFARLLFEPGHDRRNAVAAYAATAGAILTKGLAGFGFILLPVAVFLLLSWKRLGSSRWKALASPLGLLTLVLLAAPWYAYTLAQHGETFTAMFIGDQVTKNVGGISDLLANLVQYPVLFLRETLPWSLLLLLALLTDDGRLRSALRQRRSECLFLLTWLAVVCLVLVGANFTRGRFLLVVAPAASVLAGLLLARLADPETRPRGTLWGLHVLAAVAALFGLACLAHSIAFAALGVGWTPAEPVVAVLLLSGAVALFLLTRRKLVLLAALSAGALNFVTLVAISAFFTPAAPTQPIAALARDVLPSLRTGTRVSTVGLSRGLRAVILLESGLRADAWTDSEDPPQQAQFLRDLLAASGPALVFINDKSYSALPQDLRSRFPIFRTRSGLGKLDLKARFRGRPASLTSFLESSILTFHALRASSPGGLGVRN